MFNKVVSNTLIAGMLFLGNQNYLLADNKEATVSDIALKISNIDTELSALQADLAAKKGQANKNLVDLEIIQTNKLLAKQQQDEINKNLKNAETEVVEAQKEVKDYIKNRYNRKVVDSTINSIFNAGAGKDFSKSYLFKELDDKEKNTLDNLIKKRNKAANLVAAKKTVNLQANTVKVAYQAKYGNTLNNVTDLINFTNQQKAKIDKLQKDKDVLAVQLQAKKMLQKSGGKPDKIVKNLQKQNGSDLKKQQNAANKVGQVVGQVATETATTVANTIVNSYASGASEVVNASSAASDGSASAGSNGAFGSSPSFNGVGSLEIFLSRFTNPQIPLLIGPLGVERVAARGMSQLGVPYAWGGGNQFGPTIGVRDGGVADAYGDFMKIGYDCSGLMVFAFASVGLSLPHYSGYQYAMGRHVPIGQIRRGDMLFYGPGGSQHVALYLGGGKMLEAPQSGDVVKISPVRYGGVTPDAVRLL